MAEVEEECFEEIIEISSKERTAIKRRLKYREDEEYRNKVKQKAKASKQREEYRQSQKEYNRLYYRQRKEQMKQQKESQRELTFKAAVDEFVSGDPLEFVYEANREEEEVIATSTTDDYYTLNVEEAADGSYIVKEEEDAMEDLIEVTLESPIIEVEEIQNITDWYSYPKVREIKRQGKRSKAKTKSTADKMIQVDLDEDEEPLVNLRKTSQKHTVSYVVDFGVQCSSNDFLI